MTDKKPVPPSLAQFALEQLVESGEQAAIDLTVQNVEILRAENERLRAELSALKTGQGEWVIVPAVASMDMKNAGWREIERQGIDPESCEMQSIYHAMVAAAQRRESE